MEIQPLYHLILCGLIFLIVGIITLIFKPKKINSFYGYRTTSSMKSQERWDFAQRYSAKELIKMGLLMVIIGSAVGLLLNPNKQLSAGITVVLILLAAILLIMRVEFAIKRKFKETV